MSLFNEMESCADPDAHEPDLVEVEKHLRKGNITDQREKLIKDIPRSKVLHTIDERNRSVKGAGAPWQKSGRSLSVLRYSSFLPASK